MKKSVELHSISNAKAPVAQGVIVAAVMLLIGSSIFGGPLGIVFRGERHALLLVVFVSVILCILAPTRKLVWSGQRPPRVTVAPLIFFLITLLWIFPFGSYSPEQFRYGLTEIQSLILLLVAPLVFIALFRSNIDLYRYGRWVVLMCALLAALQVVVWISLRFNLISFNSINHLFANLFRTTESIYILRQPSNHGDYVRVVWVSSYWLLFVIFISPLVFRNFASLILLQALFALAAIASYTRGLWLELIVGFVVFTVVINLFSLRQHNPNEYRKIRSLWHASLIGLVLAFAVTLALDWVQGSSSLLLSRLDIGSQNAFAIKDESAIERMLQVVKLIDMWKESPIIGHGWGAYMKDHFSHDSRPFLYEMVPFALLMKLGAFGFLVYIAFLLFIQFRLLRIGSPSATAVLAGLIGYLIAAHTNPVFFSFTGMLIFSIYICLWLSLEYELNSRVIDPSGGSAVP